MLIKLTRSGNTILNTILKNSLTKTSRTSTIILDFGDNQTVCGWHRITASKLKRRDVEGLRLNQYLLAFSFADTFLFCLRLKNNYLRLKHFASRKQFGFKLPPAPACNTLAVSHLDINENSTSFQIFILDVNIFISDNFVFDKL